MFIMNICHNRLTYFHYLLMSKSSELNPSYCALYKMNFTCRSFAQFQQFKAPTRWRKQPKFSIRCTTAIPFWNRSNVSFSFNINDTTLFTTNYCNLRWFMRKRNYSEYLLKNFNLVVIGLFQY